jgi:hypothetical protein
MLPFGTKSLRIFREVAYVLGDVIVWQDRLCSVVVRSFWLHIQMSRVRFPALPDFFRSRGSGTGSTQPREDNLRSYLNEKK